MSSKLVPGDPSAVMVIRNVTPEIVTLSLPFLRFGTVKIGGRATIVKMTSGSLAVFSPVALTPEVKSKVESMGNDIKYILAPDMEHHIFLSDWLTAFPSAKIIGPEGLSEKREKDSSVTNVPILEICADTKAAFKVDDAFDRDFDIEFVEAHVNKEIVALHRPSRTLIQADLMFNLPATEQYSKTGEDANSGIFTKLFGSMQHTRGEAMGQRRLLWAMVNKAGKPSFDKSIRRINGWDFERIIPCHGDVIETGGKAVFSKVFKWNLEATA